MKPTRPSWLRAIITIAAGLLLVKITTGCAGPLSLRIASPDGAVQVDRGTKGGLAVGVEIRPAK